MFHVHGCLRHKERCKSRSPKLHPQPSTRTCVRALVLASVAVSLNLVLRSPFADNTVVIADVEVRIRVSVRSRVYVGRIRALAVSPGNHRPEVASQNY